jgi:hypothetical protein
MEIPLKPYPPGKLATTFGGPAESPLDVLTRARAALSPRGAWSARGWNGKTNEGYARCLVHTFSDVDGNQVESAKKIMLRAIREKYSHYTSVESFNDSPEIKKHHMLDRLDRAIEIASG